MTRLAFLMLLTGAGPAMASHELLERNLTVGEALFQEHCAACHGADLEGEPDWRSPKADGTLPAPPHDESGHTWHHHNQQLFDYTKLGGQAALAALGVDNFKSGMPGFDGVISDEDIWDILAYIRSTWPVRVQQMQAERNPSH